ncbi:cytochrome-c oxidase, cbb3-type subunit III [Pelagibacterium limicola]|uniref:cytochrome-c oxidase, cbb3-type subunit III n=1 Tax=Pelagibacterium limicola TaxID=2791022 RepID=UPI0018AFF9CE|nr:cytochrome-c oxidase, cbb3-type subunit III [Pelagibacterium limicola]
MSAPAPDRDPVTGRLTTGHEWNGIKELGTPVPRIVFIGLTLGALYLIVWTILMPAWPGINSYTRGLLGIDQRTSVEARVALARLERAEWTQRIETEPLATLASDPQVMNLVKGYGKTLFGDNCQACHGGKGVGNSGFPNISQAPLMWGDDLDTIHETIRVGINAAHPETRFSQMLAFGRDGMLGRSDILAVTDYLLALGSGASVDDMTHGAEVFAFNCASCHGDNARGSVDFGAPDLVDDHWIYGGYRQAVFNSIFTGRAGHMPSWEGRLSKADLRILALYVGWLRENQP